MILPFVAAYQSVLFIVFLYAVTVCFLQLQQCRTELDPALPAPLYALDKWLQSMEAVLSEEQVNFENHASAARDARGKQEKLKVCKTAVSV